ncbi:hypothetical protein CA267_005630 [Alteromonas pelagimontana]|uniref:Lipoprotein n=1 Tax=Alteromonas pelagimontana TaxID=1858656 RepID=A0A6M4MAT6_9ALTE|nr:hypothetical protein [Alteromonas pelagimontana]QJR80294.1 hypothetical protein CA267_005630 [Alteromonas pelagimontana]
MELMHLFRASAIATALVLAGCGGDVNISEGDIDNSVENNYGNGGTPTNPETPEETLPGTADSSLTNAVSAAFGSDIEVRILSGRLTADDADDSGTITLTNDRVWALDGAVFFGNDNADSVNIVVEEGTIIFGSSGNDYMVVSRGSTIEAQGTAENPIIFTSYPDVVGEEVMPGQWGGLILLGNAPSNQCPAEGDCALQIEGAEEGAVFGGTDDADSSGSLRYVVMKYSGFEISPDNELQGLTMGGVGSGTTVDYLQVHASSDDGVEFFGGSPNLKHMVLTSNQDDSVDWDNGFTGKMQYVFVQHAPDDSDANRGIEADNDGSAPDNSPQSNPMIANMTIIGNNFDGDDDSEGVYLREGTGAQIYNMVVSGPSGMGECLEVENVTESQANLQDGTITIQNSVMACANGENFVSDEGAVDLEDWFLNTMENNQISESVMLNSDGTPTAGSPLLGAGTDASQVDGFFEANDFIGALDGTNDWRQGWAFGYGGGEVRPAPATVEGCPAGTTEIDSADGVTTTCELSGRYTTDLTLTENNLYAISGAVFIGGDNADSATLTIPAGVTLYGASGNDYMVISRGSEIDANGSASKPITFSSEADIASDAGVPGQWGGLILLGNAPSNQCPATGDCALQIEGAEEGAVFGGTDEADSSGRLRYVRILYSGFEISPDNELQGLTMGGVGSGTDISYVQIHASSDDGVEFFGGNVDVKYLVLTDNQDDSIDWDNGYRGRMQYVLVRHAEDNSDANRGIEADNDGSNPANSPQSNPVLSNVTIIGNTFDGDDDSEGVYLREGTGAQLSNFIVTGPSGMGECFEVENVAESQANLSDGTITFTNSVIACENGENFNSEAGAVDLADWFSNTMTGNAVVATRAEVVDGIFTISTLAPKDWSGDTFFDNAGFVGAVSADNNWTSGWTVGLE